MQMSLLINKSKLQSSIYLNTLQSGRKINNSFPHTQTKLADVLHTHKVDFYKILTLISVTLFKQIFVPNREQADWVMSKQTEEIPVMLCHQTAEAPSCLPQTPLLVTLISF